MQLETDSEKKEVRHLQAHAFMRHEDTLVSYYSIRIPKKPLIISVIVLLAIFLIILSFGTVSSVSAEKAQLYPKECLGNWQQADLASGEPTETAIIKEHAAVFTEHPSQLFCGNFAGSIPEKSTIRSVSLSLKWNIVDEEQPIETHEVVVESAPVDVVPETVVSEEEVQVEEQPQQEEIPAESVIEQAPEEQGPETEPAEALQTEPIAFFFAPHIAHAEGEEGSVPIEAATTEPATFIDSGVTNETDNADELFVIRYSIDGSTWTDAGHITRENFSDALVLPRLTIDEIAQLKISIESTSNAAEVHVLLDAVRLDVGYVSTEVLALEALEGRTSDAKKFAVGNIVSGADIELSFATDPDQGDAIVVQRKKVGDSVRFYKIDEPGFNIASGIGDGPLVMPAYQFTPGSYIVALSKEPSVCSDRDIETCRASRNYVSEATFTIAPTLDSPIEYQDPQSLVQDLIAPVDTQPDSVPTADTATSEAADPAPAPDTQGTTPSEIQTDPTAVE